MKVLLDTNVLISYLLSPHSECTVTQVLRTCLLGPIQPIVPPELLVELRQTVRNNESLRARILHADVERLGEQLARVGEVPAPLTPQTSFGRDPDDDYLVAHGLVSGAAYLVTGDADLLVLDPVETLRIVTPGQFVRILQEEGIL